MKSSGQDLTIEDLKDVSKLGFYQECEVRLRNFIDHLTVRKNLQMKTQILKQIYMKMC